MDNLIKKIEVSTNIAIILVALLLSTVLIKNYLSADTTSKNINPVVSNNELHNGGKMALPDVDWAKNGQTLVLALSTTCHYCSESAPFYQRLAQKHGDIRLVAVLPQPTSNGQQYLGKMGVSIEEVKQASFEAIGVRGTPTLLLVDKNGVVTNTWIGKLPATQETEVINHLQAHLSQRAS